MYNKQSLAIDEQIVQLINRGLVITDSDSAFHFLSHISYYRLAGYHRTKHKDYPLVLHEILTKYYSATE